MHELVIMLLSWLAMHLGLARVRVTQRRNQQQPESHTDQRDRG